MIWDTINIAIRVVYSMLLKQKIINILRNKVGLRYRRYNNYIHRKARDKCTTWGGNNICGKGSVLNNSEVGYMTYFGNECFLPNCIVGKYCSIGDRVMIIAGNHPTSKFVSTHPAFYSTDYVFSFVQKQKFLEHTFCVTERNIKVEIGNDVWIGSDARILEGVHIGNGAIVAAGALVASDVEPYSVVGGVPAREIKKRFTPKQIEVINDSCWWDYKSEFVQSISDSFENIEEFLAEIQKERN